MDTDGTIKSKTIRSDLDLDQKSQTIDDEIKIVENDNPSASHVKNYYDSEICMDGVD